MDLYEELRRVVDVLEDSGIEYALCGGLALAVHGHPRATKDIDLLLPRENVPRAVDALRGVGYTIDAGEIPFGAGGPRERNVRRISRVEGDEMLTLDLLLLPDWLDGVWRSRERFEWGDRKLTVVSRDGLRRMKRVAARTQDLADVERLEDPDDVEEVG